VTCFNQVAVQGLNKMLLCTISGYIYEVNKTLNTKRGDRMSRKSMYILFGLFLMGIALVSILVLNNQSQRIDITMGDETEFIDEDIPLGELITFEKIYLSGYGIEWRYDPIANPTRFIGYDNDVKKATITVLGDTSESLQLVGLNRLQAQNILGEPITIYNNLRMGNLNTKSRAYYQRGSDLIILHFDTLDTINPNRVIMATTIDGTYVSKSFFFTRIDFTQELTTSTEEMALDLLNALRQAYTLEPLAHHEKLYTVAKKHSLSMVQDNYFSHTNKQGKSAKDRIVDAGIPYKSFGEALTAGSWTPMDAMASWVNSPGHRTIIFADYTSAGLGIATGKATYGIYYTLKVISE
jgi:uncharacterized protein YkwD